MITVTAEFKTDDGRIKFDFDATKSLSLIPDKDVLGIIADEFGQSDSTELLAEKAYDWNEKVKMGLDYVRIGQELSSVPVGGFEVWVHPTEFAQWFMENKPHLKGDLDEDMKEILGTETRIWDEIEAWLNAE